MANDPMSRDEPDDLDRNRTESDENARALDDDQFEDVEDLDEASEADRDEVTGEVGSEGGSEGRTKI
jgi:hypothetical protein